MAIKGSKGGQHGAALIEAAMVLPILLMLTFGIWTTARAWNVNNTMQHSAREAARFAATVDPWDPSIPGGSPEAARAVADADLSGSSVDPMLIVDCIEFLVAGASAVCDPSHTNNTNTDQIYVQLKYQDYPLNFLFFSADIDMRASAISRFEAP